MLRPGWRLLDRTLQNGNLFHASWRVRPAVNAVACHLVKCSIAFAPIPLKLDGSRLPRHRGFDEGTAIEAAMQRFWAAGYAATSVRDLGEAMGLGQASVYNAFGDKRTLFTQCLDRYLDANMRARIARLARRSKPFWPRSLNARSTTASAAFWLTRRWRWRRMIRTLLTSWRHGSASWRHFFGDA